MSTAEQDAILRSVVDFYFDSGDFNGYPVYRLKADHPLSDAAVRSLLPALVSAGLVDVMCGKDRCPSSRNDSLLEQWIKKYFRPQEPEPIAKMLATFRHVRQARQKPAHSVDEDKFDQKYFREQRQLVVDAYDAVRTLRLMLATHPTVRANPPEINDLLYKGKIWDI